VATVGIPASIEDVTAAWLAEATGLAVESFEVDQIGQGIGVSSAVYRLRLQGGGCPDAVVVKLPALDEAAVFTSTVLSMYLREVRFFSRLAQDSPIRVPQCHHAAADDETSQFVVVMEDLSGFRVVDQTVGMALEDARAAVDGLARWHAAWWGKAAVLATEGITLSLDDPIYPAVLPMVLAEGWAKVIGAGIELPGPILALEPAFTAAIPGLLEDLAEAPTTLIHGDYRADNLVFAPDGSVAAFDFQLIGTGCGAYDLAYFLTQSLDPDLARAAERGLFDRWVAGLGAAGVADADPEHLWTAYRKAALFCLVYPIVAARGMDLDDPRQRDLVVSMLRRFERAVDDLRLADLL
jgi:hypothetical protein